MTHRAYNGSTIRQGDEPPAYESVINNGFAPMPIIPNSTQIYPVQPMPPPPPNTYVNPTPSLNQPNLGFRPLPSRVVPSGNVSVRIKRNNRGCINKKALIAICTMSLIIIACIGLIILVVYVVRNRMLPTASSTRPICAEGFSILDCTLECGVASTTSNFNRIVGGNIAVASSWPSMTLIIFKYSAVISIGGQYYRISSSSMCGGTLIDKKTVLTAAHCIQDSISYSYSGQDYTYTVKLNDDYPSMESMYTVYLGVHDRTDLTSASGVVSSSVRKISKHANYDSYNTLNDIALLHLTSEVQLTDKIQVACLPSEQSSDFPPLSYAAYAAGWGTLSYGGSSSSVLRDVSLTIYSNNLCSNVAPSYKKDWDSQMCVGDLLGNKDTCRGDSGGPLFIKKTINNRVKYVSVGITSYGVGCAEFAKPAIYTRVSNYYDWIRTNNSNRLSAHLVALYTSMIVIIVLIIL